MADGEPGLGKSVGFNWVVGKLGVHVLELGMRNGSVLAERALGYRLCEFLFLGYCSAIVAM